MFVVIWFDFFLKVGYVDLMVLCEGGFVVGVLGEVCGFVDLV